MNVFDWLKWTNGCLNSLNHLKDLNSWKGWIGQIGWIGWNGWIDKSNPTEWEKLWDWVEGELSLYFQGYPTWVEGGNPSN